MDISLYLDLQQEYVLSVENSIKSLENEFIIVNNIVGDMKKTSETLVIITDDVDAAQKWQNYAVIGIEHRSRIDRVRYVTDSLENVDAEFVKLVYCRKFGIPMIIKETKRLLIREITPDDVEEICSLYEDKENVRFLPQINSFEEQEEFAMAYIENMYGIYGYGLWAVILKDSGRIIGIAGIEHRDIEDVTVRELGYMISGKYQKKGYGYEAANAVLEYAREYGIDDMVVYINKKNTPSINLAHKLGFKYDRKINDGEVEYVLFRF